MTRYALPLVLTFLVGCSSLPAYPPAPAKAMADGTWNYVLGPGDLVKVFVKDHPQLSGTYLIRPDGKLTINMVEDLPASGLTTTLLARAIEQSLAHVIPHPTVTVTLENGSGPLNQQIRVIGEAMRPQALAYREKMSLIDVMISVGGLTDFAAGNKASIIRIVDGKPQQFSVRLEDLLRHGDITANIEMMPGDILLIPESWF